VARWLDEAEHVFPAAGVPLTVLAALVGYSRIHTGVHVPADVLVGALAGVALAEVTVRALERSDWL
jgi:membrane-associated phospholipid phosphatase